MRCGQKERLLDSSDDEKTSDNELSELDEGTWSDQDPSSGEEPDHAAEEMEIEKQDIDNQEQAADAAAMEDGDADMNMQAKASESADNVEISAWTGEAADDEPGWGVLQQQHGTLFSCN